MSDETGLAEGGIEGGIEDLEDLYDHAPCGHLSTLADGTILRVNRTFLNWTGYVRERLVGSPFGNLLTMAGRVFHDTHYAPMLALQGFAREIALEIQCENGTRLPVLLNAIRARAADGRTVVHRVTLIDARERRQYERELLKARREAEDAARAKSAFLATFSHELRTPLNVIVGIAHVLERGGPASPELVRALTLSSRHLLMLINDVLDLAKLEAGKLELDARPFDLRECVAGVAAVHGPAAEEKGIALLVEIDERAPAAVIGDGVKLTQVLTNLVANAVKFTAHGQVRIRLRVAETDGTQAKLAFAVEDTGIGIPADRRDAVFEDFAQASPEVVTKYGGTGLGLPICRRLLALMASEIQLETAVGRGSTFSFELDLPVTSTASAPARPDGAGDAVRGMRVLIAEDNALNAMVLGTFLRGWGIDFDCVDNGRSAVEKAQTAVYDLVLMDLHMPALDGAEATRLIRAAGGRLATLPIVAISATGDESGAIPDGFTDLMPKPFHPDRLLALLAAHRKSP